MSNNFSTICKLKLIGELMLMSIASTLLTVNERLELTRTLIKEKLIYGV